MTNMNITLKLLLSIDKVMEIIMTWYEVKESLEEVERYIVAKTYTYEAVAEK